MSTVGVCFSCEADNKKQRMRRKGKQDKDKKGGGDKEKTTVCMCFLKLEKKRNDNCCLLSGAPVSSGSFSRAFGASCATLTVPDRHATSRERRVPVQARGRAKAKKTPRWSPLLATKHPAVRNEPGQARVLQFARAQLADRFGAPAASQASFAGARAISRRRRHGAVLWSGRRCFPLRRVCMW